MTLKKTPSDNERGFKVGGRIVVEESAKPKSKSIMWIAIALILGAIAIGFSPVGKTLSKGASDIISDAAESHTMKRDVAQ